MIKESYNLVYGIGVKGMKYPAKKDKKHLIECRVWASMLMRCYSKSLIIKKPCYDDCTVSDNFKSYTFFYEWCHEQAGFGNKDENGRYWHLDKDILTKGNRLYSETTCAFVPQRINSLLIKCDSARGEYLVGVSWRKDKNKFASQCRLGGGKRKLLGYFLTAQEAHQAYKLFKEALIKEVADEYKTQLDPRVYEALMNYKVESND